MLGAIVSGTVLAITGTLAVALLGLILAIVSLTWQVIAWRWSGARIRVTVSSLVILDDFAQLARETIQLTVRNVGRTAAHIRGWGFRHGRTVRYATPIPGPAGSSPPSLPLRLEALHEESWCVPLSDLRGDAKEHEVVWVRGFVRMGTGREKISLRSVPVPSTLRPYLIKVPDEWGRFRSWYDYRARRFREKRRLKRAPRH